MSNCSGSDQERRESRQGPRQASEQPAGALSGIPVGLPALTRALKLAAEGRQGGFDWNDPMAVLAKIREEARTKSKPRSAQASARNPRQRRVTCCSRSSTSHVISMPIPRQCCARPIRNSSVALPRSKRALKARNKTPGESTLAEMDALWDEAKAAEK